MDNKPLAEMLRPKTLTGFIGQKHLVGKQKPLRKFIEKKVMPPSIIFWGPPGSGKTTLARILSNELDISFKELSAVNAGKKQLQAIINQTKLTRQRVLVFIDEIHRFNKAQQDFLLPYVENGTINLIGATTENPSFEVNSALLSRSQVYTLKPLSEDEIKRIIENACKKVRVTINEKALNWLTRHSQGDARIAITSIELLQDNKEITVTDLENLNQKKIARYDKDGENHYNYISALHKSMRDSNVQASIYWLMRMLHAGEDPKYVVRRMIRFASEDIGNKDVNALTLSIATKEAVEFLGMPECQTSLVQLAAYLAKAPKSNAAYKAVHKTLKVIQETGDLPVPLVMRNAPTKLMKKEGYGKEYIYAHDNPEGAKKQQNMPKGIQEEIFYEE